MTKDVTIEVLVSDNASDDGSAEMLFTNFPDIKLIQNKHNLGFGQANNLAIDQSNGKYVFLLNTDTYFLNNAIKILFDFMENPINANVACCGGDLYDADGTKQAAYGNFPSVLDAISQLGLYKLYSNYYKRKICGGVINQNEKIKVVDYICGADMFLRKETLDNTGYFDKDFFLYFEETELSFRLHKAGYKSMLVPSAKIVHLEGGSQKSNAFNLFKIEVFARSRKLYFKKTRGTFIANLVNYIFVVQSFSLFVIKRNKNYLKQMQILFKV